ncbi:preprotein translocase subunit SecA [Clostridium algidicarnis]|uniref:preprotein translocase subunit SecA n=1 Tax=Clostridium algidicarnis TaxID=37659 RepID=UPI001C0D13CE|nr:preprotein translocase subunit SecA [Clostridium algidicarnis]MBU3205005.1 preprotein translocase subunit SecA [Clostridium algidicarnis]MBU3213159.1 preprotein translocase subunit SecA [Clostridium algidicarnis]MBU3223214.1 preprotein translocase subunit SecA [Clostridium algidicarnis]
MKKFIEKIYDYNAKEIKRIMPLVTKIESLDEYMVSLTDEELRHKTLEFKERLDKGETLDDLLVEAFAVTREAAYRVLHMKHYPVQLMGGIILHQGRVSEMKTGEGKTLVATCPAYLNALSGKGVHVVTTNEYLAKRDSEEMGQVFNFLGLTTGVILHELTPEERRETYNKDIVYGINSEIGFDYLRNNMATSRDERIQRDLNYAIVDEIDSILIDEARTPLIISGEGEEATEYYITIDEFVKELKKDVDFEVDEKKKAVTLTDEGIERLEKYFDIDNYADKEHLRLRHHITQSLKANYEMTKDIDYIENDEGEILIVDTFTGRVMEGRRFSDGIHEAIEAKEDVDIQPESQILATITLQNLFRTYTKLSGMSGTVVTEEEEFREIYNLDVIVVPTNEPIQRIDRADKVYTDISSKYYAIASDVKECYEKGQPVLVGTASIQKSEDISALLKRMGIPHHVLNAKNHENEAKIIARAGEVKAVTIATNMAGRGTDIKLSDEVKSLGGLKVIGTERHDSRRVDNQLRGRSGRQGEPGESVFYVSLEDDVVKNYISQKYKNILEKLVKEKGYIDSPSANKAVELAQHSIEGDGFHSRKDIVGYDDTLNKQREVIYNQRNLVLDEEDTKAIILDMISGVIEETLNTIVSGAVDKSYDMKRLSELNIIDEKELEGIKAITSIEEAHDLSKEIFSKVVTKYSAFEEKVGIESTRSNERHIILSVVDKLWIDYLNEIDIVRQGVNLRSYKQVDPVQIFMLESSELFNDMTYSIKEEVVTKVLSSINNVETELV